MLIKYKNLHRYSCAKLQIIKSIIINMQKNYRICIRPSHEARGNQKIELQSGKLFFVGAGLNHLVLQNQNVPGQIIAFELISQDYSEMEYFIFDLMEQVHDLIVESLYPIINNIRWRKQKMYIQNLKSRQTEDFFAHLEEKFSQDFQKQKDSLNLQSNLIIDKGFRTVKVSTNIFKVEGFNSYVEFKMKTVLPNLYSERNINQVSEKMGIESSKIKELLKTKKPIEKIRWFIKNMQIKFKELNRVEKQNKKCKNNESPFHIMGVGPKPQKIPNFVKSKLFKKIPQLSVQQQEKLNKTMFQYIQNHKQLLNSLHKIQASFNYSSDVINRDIDYTVLTGLNTDKVMTISRQQIIKKLFEKTKFVLQHSQPICLDAMYQYLVDCDCISKNPYSVFARHVKNEQDENGEDAQYEKLAMFLLYLISFTWRDVSFVFMAKFDNNTFDNPQMMIIDDYLKSYGDVTHYVIKDSRMLQKIVKLSIQNKETETTR